MQGTLEMVARCIAVALLLVEMAEERMGGGTLIAQGERFARATQRLRQVSRLLMPPGGIKQLAKLFIVALDTAGGM